MNTRDVLEILKQRIPQDTAFVVSLGRTADEAFTYFPKQTLFLDRHGRCHFCCVWSCRLGLRKLAIPLLRLTLMVVILWD